MKKKLYISLLLALPFLAACESYLRVQPDDRYIDEQVYESEAGIQMSLNGIYLKMTDNAAYGASLTNTHIELLAQRYNTSASGSPYKQFCAYKYDDADYVKPAFSSIWRSAYNNILEINVFIENVEPRAVIASNKKDLLLGEAYALRAFLHFDMLRIFGQVYAVDSTTKSIPYTTGTKAEIPPLLPDNQIIANVLQDLAKAEQLLQNDPIRSSGPNSKAANPVDFYNFFRNRRMNYFAVKALQARVYLYQGNKTAAAQAASLVLTQARRFFPWADRALIRNPTNPDRIFSSEVIFGIQNPRMYNMQRDYFQATLRNESILMPIQSNNPEPNTLDAMFERYTSDDRYIYCWLISTTRSERTFFKYDDIPAKDSLFRMFQPLIRKSELYYILAECESNTAAAMNLLDTVRANRGLGSVPMRDAFDDELRKEYIKEFYGEGQLFYFYKRRNVASIPRGNALSGSINPTYVVPLPDVTETDIRTN